MGSFALLQNGIFLSLFLSWTALFMCSTFPLTAHGFTSLHVRVPQPLNQHTELQQQQSPPSSWVSSNIKEKSNMPMFAFKATEDSAMPKKKRSFWFWGNKKRREKSSRKVSRPPLGLVRTTKGAREPLESEQQHQDYFSARTLPSLSFPLTTRRNLEVKANLGVHHQRFRNGLRAFRRVFVCFFFMSLIGHLSFWTSGAQATTTSSMGLLSQTADFSQIFVSSPQTPTTAASATTVMNKLMEATGSNAPTLGKSKVARIIASCGTALLTLAGVTMLANRLTEDSETTRTRSRETIVSQQQALASKDSLASRIKTTLERDEVSSSLSSSSTTSDFAIIKNDFDRIRKIEEEHEGKLQLAKKLLSEIDASVTQSGEALSKSAAFFDEPKYNATRSIKILTDPIRSEDGIARFNAENSPLDTFLVGIQEAETAATLWKKDYDDFRQDLYETKNRKDNTDNIILPPPVEETTFGEWLNAMKVKNERQYEELDRAWSKREAQSSKRSETRNERAVATKTSSGTWPNRRNQLFFADFKN